MNYAQDRFPKQFRSRNRAEGEDESVSTKNFPHPFFLDIHDIHTGTISTDIIHNM